MPLSRGIFYPSEKGCLRKLVINELNFIQTRLLLYLCRFTTTTITMNKLPRKTVLHVDDDPDDRELIAEAIKDADSLLRVHQENNGNAGLKYLHQCKIEGHLPCLIILDINMPEMDGRQAAKMIKADSELREIPLIIFTTSSYPLDQKYFNEQGIKMVTKPTNMKNLSSAIRELLDHCPPE